MALLGTVAVEELEEDCANPSRPSQINKLGGSENPRIF